MAFGAAYDLFYAGVNDGPEKIFNKFSHKSNGLVSYP
jgi:hypothetical protein